MCTLKKVFIIAKALCESNNTPLFTINKNRKKLSAKYRIYLNTLQKLKIEKNWNEKFVKTNSKFVTLDLKVYGIEYLDYK